MLLKTCRATAEFAKGIPQREIPALPTVKEPETWEFSAHPHKAERAGEHIDLRLGDPKSGVAHSLVLPKGELPAPGKSALVIPTFGHTLEYMDYTGPIEKGYGKGVVTPGRRTKAEVYHADPTPGAGTKLRFNLYEGAQPEEYAVRKDAKGRWFLHNKTQTRPGRPDIPDFKPKYKEIDVDDIDPTNEQQAMMPKLDGAHGIIDLIAGRAPRVFSYRVGKKAETGFIEHTHKMPELLKKKVPKELDGTVLRGEILGIKGDRVLPAEQIGGLLNSKVWKSLETQKAEGVRLKAFPFDVVKYRGRPASERSFGEKLELLRKVEEKLRELQPPPVVVDPKEKIELLNLIRAKKHPLTDEGVVLVDKDAPGRPIKAKFTPDFDVFVRDVHPAISGDTGEAHNRAGSISYSWSPDGPIAGQLGGFKHQEAKDMLANPDKYVGRVAKVKAMRVFTDDDGNPKALFQPRFKEWHLDKGDIEKTSSLLGFMDELEKIAISLADLRKLTLLTKARSFKAPSVPGPTALTSYNMKPHLNLLQSMGLRNEAQKAKQMLRVAKDKVLLPYKGDFLRNFEKNILRPSGGGILFPETHAAVQAVKKAPEARRALEGIVKGHELQELAKARKGFIGVHAAGVIPVEHNMLATLPREARPAGDLMRAMRRELGSEAKVFERATRRPGGQTLTYGEGPRLSRHAVKRITARMKVLEKERQMKLLKEVTERLERLSGV